MPVTVNQRNRTPITSGGPLKLNTEDRIDEVDPRDTPFLRMLGWGEDAQSNAASKGANSLSFDCFEKVHTWNNDSLTPNVTGLGTAYTTGDLVLAVTTDTGAYFNEDDLVLVVEAANTQTHYRVVSVSADNVTVSLLSGSDNSATTAAAQVHIIGNARTDGGIFDTLGRQTTVSQTSNFTQIFQRTTGVTGTELAIEQFGIPRGTSFDRELSKSLQALVKEFEKAVVMGLRNSSAPSTNVQPVHRMGGAWYYLRDSTGGSGAQTLNASDVPVTEVLLNNLAENIWDQGGRPNTIVTSYVQARNMQSFIRPFLQADFERTKGGIVIEEWLSTNGPMNIIISRWLPHAGDILFLDFEQLGFGPLSGRELSIEELPKDGDYMRASILGEYTMEFKNNTTHHGWGYNFSTTGLN